MRWIRDSRHPSVGTLPVTRLMTRLVCAVVLIGLAPAVRANTVVFATGTQMLGGYAENAQATFDINNTTHTITVHLLNLELNPTDVDQAIGSLRFTLTGAGNPTPTSATPTGISDTVLDISNNGTPTKVAARDLHGWRDSASAQASGWQIALCAVCAAGGTNGLIIGGPNATTNGKYSTADTTLKAGTTAQWIIGSGLTYTGTGTNNRLAGMDTTPDFTITFPTTTNLSNVVITNVIFGFGESANYGWNYDHGAGGDAGAELDDPVRHRSRSIGAGTGVSAVCAGPERGLRATIEESHDSGPSNPLHPAPGRTARRDRAPGTASPHAGPRKTGDGGVRGRLSSGWRWHRAPSRFSGC